jgi:hypothetical protein
MTFSYKDSSSNEFPEPIFLTLLASADGIVRYKGHLPLADTNYQAVEILISIEPEGDMEIATRPLTERTWSAPTFPKRV